MDNAFLGKYPPPNNRLGKALFNAPANRATQMKLFPEGLPADYLDFASIYGSGVFECSHEDHGRRELTILNPFDPQYERTYLGTAKPLIHFLRTLTDLDAMLEVCDRIGIEPPDRGEDPNEYRRRAIENAEGFPLWYYPDLGGLLIWGFDDAGASMCWITDGDPHEWTIGLFASGGAYKDIYRMNFSEFLSKLFAGELESEVFPDFDRNWEIRFVPGRYCYEHE